ncbi:MAG: hypothetical protein IPN32_06840 [Deltaproteobacteria bacterium]|nr:hypothetical protein [Deltaproteobacteria bacterium]
MLVSVCLALAIAAPAPATAAAPAGRDYEGPRQVVPEGGVAMPEVVAPAGDAGTTTGADAGTTTGADAGTTTGADAGTTTGADAGTTTGADAGTTTGADAGGLMPPTEPGYVPKKKRPVPRALATIEGYGYPEDEIAVVGKRRVKFTPGFQVRNQVGTVTPFTLDRFGHRYRDHGMTTGRIRWNPTLAIGKKFKLVGMLDLANGRWAPDGSDDPVVDRIIQDGQPPERTKLRIVDPRELYLEYRLSFGLLRLGQQAFTWGQGMLANSGNYVDRFGDLRFGDDGRGGIYERLLFATKPFQYRGGKVRDLVIGVGGDLVFRDQLVELTKGDLAGQALLLLRYAPEKNPGNQIGAYAVYRKQKKADDGDVYPHDDTTEVGVVDIEGQGTRWLSDKLQLIGAFETAIIFGRSTIARRERPHKIVQGGGVARGYIGKHDSWLVGFDAGYASGDPNPSDRFINNFTMDPGHTVGLVLFNQVNAWRSAQTEMLATDGQLTGVPLNGTQYLPTRGGVSNALYIQPKARWAFRERLEIWGGPLLAVAPVPIIDPYTTRLNGGVPTNSSGGDGGKRYYGTELDVGIRGRVDIRKLWLMAGLQGGVLLPGLGLANAAGSPDKPSGAVWFRTEIRY